MKKLVILLLLPFFASCVTQNLKTLDSIQEVVQSKRNKSELFALSNMWAVKPLETARAEVEYQHENVGVIMGKMTIPLGSYFQPKTVVRAMVSPKEIDFKYMIEVKDKKARLTFYNPSQRSEMEQGNGPGLAEEIIPEYKDFIASLVKRYSDFVETYNIDW